MSPEDDDSSQPISDAEAQAKAKEIAKWTAERDAVLWHDPEGMKFYKKLNPRIAAIVSPGCRNWPEVEATNRFQEAFDLITERVLSVDGFRNVMEKYAIYLDEHTMDESSKLDDAKGSADAKPPLSKWDYMINRVNLILSEWRSSRRDKPTLIESPDEHIESTATNKPEREEFPWHQLSLRFDRLELMYRATINLWLWPIQQLPEEWREKYLPTIFEAGIEKGLTRDDVEQRLGQVMEKRQPVSEDGLTKATCRLNVAFNKQRDFDLAKRSAFGNLLRLERSGELSMNSSIEDTLKDDCYEAVKKSTAKQVAAMFPSEDLLTRAPIGTGKIHEANWLRARFCKCCYHQKYHRRVWLNARIELLNMKPENGPMAHADIGWILNIPVNTSYSYLSRAVEMLVEGGICDELSNLIQLAGVDDSKEQKGKLKSERFDSRLNEAVCEDLKPSAG